MSTHIQRVEELLNKAESRQVHRPFTVHIEQRMSLDLHNDEFSELYDYAKAGARARDEAGA